MFSVLGSSTFPFLSLKLFIRVIRYTGVWIFGITRKIHYLRNSVRREEKIALILHLFCCVAKFPNTRTFDVKLRMLERLSKSSSPPFRALFPLASLLDTHSVRSFRIFPQICLYSLLICGLAPYPFTFSACSFHKSIGNPIYRLIMQSLFISYLINVK